MALIGTLRGLAGLAPKAPLGAASLVGRDLQGALFGSQSACYATGMTKKDAAYMLDARDDPETDAALKEYVKGVYAGAKEPAGEEDLPLAAKVEKKYAAATVVAQGVQNIAVPLGHDGKDTSPIKRYVAQLNKLAANAGFEPAAVEVEKRLAEKAATAETVKDFLGRIAPLTSADFHAALSDALNAVEAETNATVTMDASSPGYKAFAKKVEGVAAKAGIPVAAVVGKSGDDAAQSAYAAWAESAAVADAAAEIEVLKSNAAAALDKHLTKTGDEVRAETAAAVAALQKKIAASAGAPWAEKFQADLKNVAWFDAAVAANPAAGPKASA